jgi:hypothetical protein
VIKRRSFLGRLLKAPSVFVAHYQILRKYNSRRESVRAGFALLIPLLKVYR